MCVEKRLCGICARIGKTCCQGRDIYVTSGDVARIADYLGDQDFFEFRKVSDAAYFENQDDPIWMEHVFRADASRRVLKIALSGDCRFLTTTGCVLPVEVRPLVCRIHPLEYHAGGFHPWFEDGCPVHLLPSGETLSQNLGITEAEAALWHRMLYSEILLEKAPDDLRA